MAEYFVGKQTIRLSPTEVKGKGGEADIYRQGNRAFKVFKTPSHPDVAGDPKLEREARERIAQHQKKLPALMKLNLPPHAAKPRELLLDKKGLVAGYEMNFVDDAEVLFCYGDPGFRENGINDDIVRDAIVDLYKTVQGMHGAGVVISDFNDLNVLLKNGRPEAYLIDVDSAGFGSFFSVMFTSQFVDPLICKSTGSSPEMIRPHSPDTDWYAFCIMLMQSLLFVGPYGGVYRPKDLKKLIPHDARPLKRITVFDPEVQYPKPARPIKTLPDDLLEFFEQVFVKDKRGVPPLSLITNLRFAKCGTCGLVHARGVCPECVGVTPVMVKEIHLGTVKGTKVFETPGQILFASMQGGTLKYVYHHEDHYRREGNRVVVKAELDPFVRYRISGERTLLARGTQCLVFGSGNTALAQISPDVYGALPLIDANNSNIFYAAGGGLYRDSNLGIEYREKIGEVLQNQTLFWVGDKMGFGFYRAAELSMFFVFDPRSQGLNDSVKLPGIRGQLVDSTCVFGRDRAWFFTLTQEGNKSVNRCFVVDSLGNVLGSAEGNPGDGSWLGKIRGACAVNDFLLVPTDDGAMRVALSGSSLGVIKEYPDTHRFVDTSSGLFIGNDGLFVVGRHEIWKLVIA